MNLALLVVSYGVSHRLFEFAWKGQLRALYPTPAAYQVGRQLAPEPAPAQHCCWRGGAGRARDALPWRQAAGRVYR